MSFINETVIIRVIGNSFSFIASPLRRVVSTYISHGIPFVRELHAKLQLGAALLYE
jgi:hypothetical protein